MSTVRVRRSGSWLGDPRSMRCANRGALVSGYRSDQLGLRPVAKAIPPDSARVASGCSWFSIARTTRCVIRGADCPALCYPFLGLRPVAKATS